MIVPAADIDARVLDALGGNPVFWTEAERRAAFNEALSVWQSMTGEWTGSAILEPNGQVFLDVPRQITCPQRVSYNGVPLDLTSIEELDLGSPGWQTRTSSLTNGGLETWTSSPPLSTPTGWTSFGTSVLDTTDRTSGSLGGKFTKEGVGSAPSGIFQSVTTTGGLAGVLELWAKTDVASIPAGQSPSTTMFMGVSQDPGAIATVSVTQDWKKYYLVTPALSSGTAVVLVQAGNTNTGEGYVILRVDDLAFYQSATPRVWAPVGFNKIALYPVPVGGILTIEGLVDPPYIPSWQLALGEDKLNMLVAYAQHVAAFKEAGVEFQSTQSGMLGLVKAAGERNMEIRATAFYKKYMGETRDDKQRPRRSGDPSAGARS